MIEKVLFFVFSIIVTGFSDKILLESYASRFDSIPIGIVEFHSTNTFALMEDVPSKIIADDLESGGRFLVTRCLKADSAEFLKKNIGIFFVV